jgi:hypothetical protein
VLSGDRLLLSGLDVLLDATGDTETLVEQGAVEALDEPVRLPPVHAGDTVLDPAGRARRGLLEQPQYSRAH